MEGAARHNLVLNVTSESFFFSLIWSSAPLALGQEGDFVIVIHHKIAYRAHGRRAVCVHIVQCSSCCLTHHCSFKISYPGASSQGDGGSFQHNHPATQQLWEIQGPFPGNLGELALSSLFERSSVCYGSCESFNCFNYFFFLSSICREIERCKDLRGSL